MTTSRGSGSASRPEPEFLNVARVLRPWGVQGELKIELLTSNAGDLAAGRRVQLGEAGRSIEVERVRAQRGSLIVKLAGIDTPEQAETLRNQLLSIPRADATPLQANQYYHHQIIGLTAVSLDGEVLGQVVEIIETGANDVYVINGPRGEVLLPARVEVIRQIDLAAGRMTVALLPGLLPE